MEERTGSGVPARRPDMVTVLVALATFLVFSGALRNGFVNWDDDPNFLLNPDYRGLAWANLRWMFTTLHLGPYQPLSWLTYGIDYLVWGMDPFGYHLTNVLLHAANAALFYRVALWFASRAAAPQDGRTLPPRLQAAFAALLFALHPLRVESVAWITERRDVLSGFFCLGAVYAYLRGHADAGRPGRGWQAACWGAFVLALLSKAIAITLPAVLVILDFYPLRRLPGEVRRWFSRDYRGVWLEKLPFLAAASLIAAVGYVGQQRGGLVLAESAAVHCARAAFGLTFYLWKTLWPSGLCPLYEPPMPFDPFAWPFLLSGAVAGLVTSGVVLSYRRWPAGAAAWACYAAVLAPVLGIVSVGLHLVADRYSYLSCLPWPLLAAAGLGWLWRRADARRRALVCLGAALAPAALSCLTWRQVKVWRDSGTLWEYAVAARPRSPLAHDTLGTVLARQGRLDEAAARYREALRLAPDFAAAHYNLGLVLARQGRTEEAAAQYRETLRLTPDFAAARNDLGLALAAQGRLDDAAAQYREASRSSPGYAKPYNNLGIVLTRQGRLAEAAAQYRQALRLDPDYADAHYNLALVLAGQGSAEESARHFLETLRLRPGDAEARRNLDIVSASGRAGRSR